MDLSFNHVNSNHSTARLGEMKIASNLIKTPTVINYTKRGALLNLTRDLTLKLPIELIHLSLEHLLELRPPSFTMAPYSLHRFIGLQSSSKSQKQSPLLILGLRDPALKNTTTTKELSDQDKFASCITTRGVMKITPEEYLSYTLPHPPDILIALADSSFATSGIKKTGKILSRSADWLNQILIGAKGITNVFAPLVGSNIEHRKDYSNGLLGLSLTHPMHFTRRLPNEPPLDQNVAGYTLTIPPSTSVSSTSSTVQELFLASLEVLPATKPRMVLGASGPHDILKLIKQVGIDLFVDHWSSEAASLGVALDFEFPVTSTTTTTSIQVEGKKLDIGQNLFNIKHARSFIPLSSSPLAIIPKDEIHPFGSIPTRSYTHHLLHQHELTSHVILAIHNQMIMYEFLNSIRNLLASKEEGKFELEVEKFFEVYSEGKEFNGGEYDCIIEARDDYGKVEIIRGKGSAKKDLDDLVNEIEVL